MVVKISSYKKSVYRYPCKLINLIVLENSHNYHRRNVIPEVWKASEKMFVFNFFESIIAFIYFYFCMSVKSAFSILSGGKIKCNFQVVGRKRIKLAFPVFASWVHWLDFEMKLSSEKAIATIFLELSPFKESLLL